MNQITLNELLCQHQLHKEKERKIFAVCLERQCKRERKMCFDCSIQKFHSDKHHKINSDIADEKQLEQLIQQFKILQDQNQLLFEKKCSEKIIVIQDKVQSLLNKIRIFDQVQKVSKEVKDKILSNCSLNQYLQMQCAENLGLYQYFDQMQAEIQKFQSTDIQIELRESNPQLEQLCSEFDKFFQLYRDGHLQMNLNRKNNENYLPQLQQYSPKKQQNKRRFELKLKHIYIIGFIINLLAIFFNFNSQYTEEYQHLPQKIQGYQEKSYFQYDQYQGYFQKRGIFNNYISKYDLAIEMFQKELKINPKCSYTLLNIAQTYQLLGQYNNAIQIYENVIKLDPDSVKSHLNQGNCYYNQNKFQQAIDMYTNALLIDPYNIDALNNKGIKYFQEGMALFQLKQYQSALQYFSKAEEINKYFIKAIYNKGITENILGLYDDASYTFDQLLILTPNDKDIIYQKGLNLYNQGKYEESNIFLDQILDVDSLNYKSINLFKLKLYDQAVLVNDYVLKLDSTNKQAIKINQVLKGEYKDE